MGAVALRVERAETSLSIRDSLTALSEKFLSSQDVAQSSRNTYRRTLRQFTEWIRAQAITSPDRETILAYKRFLEEKKLSALTVASYLVAVRKFFEWAESVKGYANVARGIKGSKRTRGFRKDPLTLEQIKDLLGSIDRSTLEGKRDFALLNLLVRTGLRTIEVTRASVGDIRQEGGEAVLWIQGKGRDAKDEFVVLTWDALKPIRDYLQERGVTGEDSPLLASCSDRNMDERLTTRTLSRIVKDHLRGIKLDSERLTAHSLRHTSITLALQAGATIQEAQGMARHASINTTMIYAHNLDRVAHAPERKIDALLAGVS